MGIVLDVLSVLVIICLLGALMYATKALKAGKTDKVNEKKQNIKMAGLFLAGYALLNVVRLLVENYIG